MHFGLFSLMTQRARSVSLRRLHQEMVVEKLTLELRGIEAMARQLLAGMPEDRTLQSMGLLGKEVMPSINRAVHGLECIGHAA
jgi:hypothetical protein